MRISIDIDEDLLNEAMALSVANTKKAVVNEALTEYVSRRKQQRILELFGQIEYDPNYNYKAERRMNG